MDLDISFHLPPHQSSFKNTPTPIPIEQLDLSFNQIPISDTLVEDILQHQSQEDPLPSRLTLPPKNILYRQIKDCLSEWYRYDSKKSLHANIYYWSTYRYLTRSHFRMIQHEELLRPQSLITYFYKEKLGWNTTIYLQGTVARDTLGIIYLTNNKSLDKTKILYFVQLTLEEQFQLFTHQKSQNKLPKKKAKKPFKI